MRLVACSNCHTQFDVTDVVAESFPCRCGASVENRDLEAVDAKIHRCGSCGAIVDAESGRCDYCGSTIECDPGKLSLICPECYARCSEDACFCTACGVPFRPEEVRVEGHELPCPVCDALMPPHQIGGIGLNECRSCNGLWVGHLAYCWGSTRHATTIAPSANTTAKARLRGQDIFTPLTIPLHKTA